MGQFQTTIDAQETTNARRPKLDSELLAKMRRAHRLLAQAEAQQNKPESQPTVVSLTGQIAIRSEFIAGGYQIV